MEKKALSKGVLMHIFVGRFISKGD